MKMDYSACVCERFMYIFPRSVCLFCCRKICGPILVEMWKLGLRQCNSFSGNTYKRFLLQSGGALQQKVTDFPIPSRDVTYQTLPGWELLNSFRPCRESLFSDIPAGDGKIVNLFNRVKSAVTLLIWPLTLSNIKIHIGKTYLFLENKYLIIGIKGFRTRL